MKQFVIIDFETGEVLIEMEIKTYNIYCILENIIKDLLKEHSEGLVIEVDEEEMYIVNPFTMDYLNFIREAKSYFKR